MSDKESFDNLPKWRRSYPDLVEKYKPGDVTIERFAGCINKDESIRAAAVRDLERVLLFHKNPIVRHEASFVALHYQPHRLIIKLMIVADYEDSLVATHEALEALGGMKGDIERMKKYYAERIAEFLKRYRIRSPNRYKDNPDIIATLEQAIKSNAAIQTALSQTSPHKQNQ